MFQTTKHILVTPFRPKDRDTVQRSHNAYISLLLKGSGFNLWQMSDNAYSCYFVLRLALRI